MHTIHVHTCTHVKCMYSDATYVYEIDSLCALNRKGLVVVVAAGNQDVDACTRSPGSASKV